jgi:RNA polymerase sigma-70 factor (ECF subfamily)
MTNRRLFPGSGICVRKAIASRWNRLYRIAYSWCHDPDLASDLVQETLARALRSRAQMPNARAFDVWLFRIMSNFWRDCFRRTPDLTEIRETHLGDGADPGDAHYGDQVLTRVRSAVGELSVQQRQVFTLVAVEGLSYEEVATVLEIPVGTVMSRLWRARQYLKDRLHDLDPAVNESGARLWRVK